MTGKHPRLTHRTRTRKSGKVVTYYFYDMRSEGETDIPLGTDYDEALKKWDELYHGKSRIAGTLEEAFQGWEKEVLPTYTSAETRKGYAKHLKKMRPAFQGARWVEIDLPKIKAYLKKRSAKTQANREMALLSIIWNWARGEGLTTVPWPAAGMERSRWKNPERPRKIKVHDDLFEAIYAEGDQTLRDCMDIGSATGMRLKDCIAVLKPRGDVLRMEASKTGKEADWDLSLSQVLPDLIRRREALDADHLMLLSTPEGQPVNLSMLRYRWDQARRRAVVKASLANDDDLVRRIRALYLRDMRKVAAQKSASLEAAAELLQHDDKRLTERHYGGVRKLKPSR